ncbi:MAG: ggt [Alphaproteobacteria bacterium]|nr:ggt [Alphaproteobacteria bacterium]
MRRRTFLAALPLAAAGAALEAQVPSGRSGGPAPSEEGNPPGFQPRGDEIFTRPDVHAGDRPAGASFASRSAVYGRSGAVGAAQPLAVLAGIEMLKKGGSAMDAAVAVNACLGFLEPTSAGIGGDVFAMLWDPALGKVVGLAGSGRSPRGLSLETVRSRAKNGALPALGAVTISVPGAVDGWWTLHRRYGRLKWAELFEPAIAYAEDGVPFPEIISSYVRRNLAAFLRPGAGVEETANAVHTWGRGPGVGEIFRNPDLARTYRMIAQGGRDAYYAGPIARTIEAYFRRIGGWMTRADLAAHHSEWTEPYSADYRGVRVHALGANTQGIATLQMLNLLEHFDMRGAGFQSPLSIHLQAEAKRLAYEDRARFYADPAFSKIPADWLVSKAYAAERARLIRPDRINEHIFPGQAPSRGDTTYFTVADRWRMMVSMIQSNFRGMGSGLVADGLGFMFQDRGQLFSLKDGHPNLYAPGKRPFQTIIPGFATRGGQPWMSFGVMGGDMQPQGQTQIVVNRADYGLDVQAAGDAPRWHHEGSSQSMGEDSPGLGPLGLLRVETGMPERTKRALAAMGWTLGASDGGFGRYHSIELRASAGQRVYAAASEMRADGLALAY